MSEHDDTLRQALMENSQLREEREATLREAATQEYAGHVRKVERIYWVYAIICVALGVAAINFFARSYDMKTLIGCAVGILVLYETTVLMKLWYATSRLKMDVLKEMKLLRLEMARLQQASGIEHPMDPQTKYEPTRGASPWERRVWIIGCVMVAMVVSTWTSQAWQLGGGEIKSIATVTLSPDGTAEKRIESVRQYSSYYRPTSFTIYTPETSQLRVVDINGNDLPITTSAMHGQRRCEVTLTDAAFVDGAVRYTEIVTTPQAATLDDGVWTYTDGIRHAGGDRDYSITILTPVGATEVSTDPQVSLEVNGQQRTKAVFAGIAEDDRQYLFHVKYRLPGGESE
ncbi:hypothetical protein Pan181_25210 [Aeoliella mucimassa]|uniref:Uncharacterized protein n=2 Tax=Aeoliella mucimassa TaxID=2527972 RepID=A0A518ANK8_9BACT|nr:hypothetical protein Pan181_25210 [Aeoliella mucimassa]